MCLSATGSEHMHVSQRWNSGTASEHTQMSQSWNSGTGSECADVSHMEFWKRFWAYPRHRWNSGRGCECTLSETEFLDKVMNLLVHHRDRILDQAQNVSMCH